MSDPMPIHEEPTAPPPEPVEELPLTETEHEPEPAPEGEPATPAATSEPSWFDRQAERQKRTVSGFQLRQNKIHEENARYRKLLAERDRQDTETKRLLAETLETVRRQTPEPQAEIPDPVLQPREYEQWVLAQNRAAIDEALKPVLTHFEAQQRINAAAQQERAELEALEGFRQQEMSAFEIAAQEYMRNEPDLAQGGIERFQDGQAMLTECFQSIGADDPAGRANHLLFTVAQTAREMGDNPVAAMDAFISSLYYGVSRRMVDAGYMQAPVMPMGAAAPAPAPAAPVRPAASEARRVEAVRQRTAAAGSLAPREPSAAPTPAKLEAQEVYNRTLRAGAVNWGEVRAAALRDTKGDMKEASMIVGRLRR